MPAYGFSFLSPSLVHHYLKASSRSSVIVGSVADATRCVPDNPSVYLWSNARAFTHMDFSLVRDSFHIFFADREYLLSKSVVILDDNGTDDIKATLSQLDSILELDAPIGDPVLSYLGTSFQHPETMFSREVRKTAGRKKKDTDPVFNSGALLRGGIKEILDMCGHSSEIRAYRRILGYLLLSSHGSFVSIGDYTLAEFERCRKDPQWAASEDYCRQLAIHQIVELTASQPEPVDGVPYLTRTVAAFDQIHSWLKHPHSVSTLCGLHQVLYSAVPEALAAHITGCDVSSLNLLCRNMDIVRASLATIPSFYRKAP